MNLVALMKQALELARCGAGRTSPNPMVGALLVKNGRIIGRGYHRAVGEKHAEVEAIESASEPVAGATLICNLEPCCHQTPEKRTPPCTRRIIEEKIARVVVSTIDPNPLVHGRGLAQLRQAGIEVQTGIAMGEALELNAPYFKFVQKQVPFYTLKIAQSLDGKIALATGQSKWITDERARQQVQQMRVLADAILVGIGTVLQDDPRLTVRQADAPQPWRIVLDSQLRLPLNARLVTDRWREKTVVFCSQQARPDRRTALQKLGVKVVPAPVDETGYISLEFLNRWLAEMNILSVLVEGGSRVFGQWIRQNQFDRAEVFIAPMFIGEGIPAVRGLQTDHLKEAPRLQAVRIQSLGDQAWIRGYRNLQETFGILAREAACSLA